MLTGLLIGLALGAALTYLWMRAQGAPQQGRIDALTAQLAAADEEAQRRLADASRNAEAMLAREQEHAHDLLAAQRAQYEARIAELERDKQSVLNSFKAAAQETLVESQKQFTDVAVRDLKQVKTEADSSIEQKRTAIENVVGEMQRNIRDVMTKVQQFEQERAGHYGKLEEQLRQLAIAESQLQQETGALRSALTTSAATTGKWGEIVLHNILAMCGLQPGIDFVEQQKSMTAEGDAIQPDMLIYLPPHRHKQVVDSKAWLLDSYLKAEEAPDEQLRDALRREFAKEMRKRVDTLGGKSYQQHVDPEIPYVVMFVPSEAAIRAAFSVDPDLFQYAVDRKVVVASPFTIFPLISLIGHAWQQQKLAENARELSDVVEELGNRVATFVENLAGVQRGIAQAQSNWNKAVGSWQGRVVPQIERSRQLGARLKETKELDELEDNVRALPGSTEENVEQG